MFNVSEVHSVTSSAIVMLGDVASGSSTKAKENTIRAIEELLHSDPAEDLPTPQARTQSEAFLDSLFDNSTGLSAPTTIESFEGSLILHWDTENKGVVLTFRAVDGQVGLYWEEIAQKKSFNSQLVRNPTPEEAAVKIEWLLER
jgi:hypothetical protein